MIGALHNLLTHGYTTIEHVLSEDEVTGVRYYCASLCTGRMLDNGVAATEGVDPENEVMLLLIRRGGALLKEWFQGVRYLSGAIIPKYPGEGVRPYHVDWWGWTDPVSYREIPPAVGVLFSLDATEHSGTLITIPGSHRRQVLDWSDRWEISRHTQRIPVTHSGTAIVIDSRMWHGSESNTTDRTRYVLTLWHMLGYEELPERIKARVRLSMDKKWKPILGDLYPEYDGDAEPIEHVQRPIWK